MARRPRASLDARQIHALANDRFLLLAGALRAASRFALHIAASKIFLSLLADLFCPSGLHADSLVLPALRGAADGHSLRPRGAGDAIRSPVEIARAAGRHRPVARDGSVYRALVADPSTDGRGWTRNLSRTGVSRTVRETIGRHPGRALGDCPLRPETRSRARMGLQPCGHRRREG